jgi:hypothetical protein
MCYRNCNMSERVVISSELKDTELQIHAVANRAFRAQKVLLSVALAMGIGAGVDLATVHDEAIAEASAISILGFAAVGANQPLTIRNKFRAIIAQHAEAGAPNHTEDPTLSGPPLIPPADLAPLNLSIGMGFLIGSPIAAIRYPDFSGWGCVIGIVGGGLAVYNALHKADEHTQLITSLEQAALQQLQLTPSSET